MKLDNDREPGVDPKLKSAEVLFKEEVVEPVVPNKDSRIESKFNELYMRFEGRYSVVFRAFDDGIAYRFIDENKKTDTVFSEKLSLELPENTRAYFPKEESMYSHNERTYLKLTSGEFEPGDFCSLPVMFDTEKAKILLTEAALHDYPGMFMKYKRAMEFTADFPKFVIEAVSDQNNSPDRNQLLVKEGNHIAEVSGGREYPWRVFMISDDDRTFIESNLVTQLSGSSKIEDPSWIKPGMVAWDWYNANNLYGVDFESGLNTETYKYYIDFASENGIEYVILDEGWTKSTTDILEWNPDMNVPELITYAKSRNVEVILWVLWKPLHENLEEIIALYCDWGAAGVKVDFMQRNDQFMVRSYERIAEVAARHNMLVDYHGAFKPAGMERVWPNIINYEGVKGNEHNKWSSDINPEHNLTIPFIRMAAGPMDFTPGAMVNKHSKNFMASFFRPMSLGTRCHQLAMYVVYEGPLQMLCESPSRYRQEQETVDFITSIPTTWDETKVLEASVSDYVVIARRKGDDWYIGAMTDDTSRDFEIRFDFLPEGEFELVLFRDGANAKNYAEDYKREVVNVDQNSSLSVSLSSGGGWVGRLRPVSE
jgi:alpha-glucosidase